MYEKKIDYLTNKQEQKRTNKTSKILMLYIYRNYYVILKKKSLLNSKTYHYINLREKKSYIFHLYITTTIIIYFN